jgi:hypothetical protein
MGMHSRLWSACLLALLAAMAAPRSASAQYYDPPGGYICRLAFLTSDVYGMGKDGLLWMTVYADPACHGELVFDGMFCTSQGGDPGCTVGPGQTLAYSGTALAAQYQALHDAQRANDKIFVYVGSMSGQYLGVGFPPPSP